jgi:hypothetical protein
MKFRFDVMVSDVIAFALSNSTGIELGTLFNDLIVNMQSHRSDVLVSIGSLTSQSHYG